MGTGLQDARKSLATRAVQTDGRFRCRLGREGGARCWWCRFGAGESAHASASLCQTMQSVQLGNGEQAKRIVQHVDRRLTSRFGDG